MRRLVALLLLVAGTAACSCGEYGSGRPAVVLAARPLRVDFGAVWVGVPVSRDVVVRNDGHRAVALHAEDLPDDFSLEPETFTVPASGEATVAVTFLPAETGARTIELALASGGGEVEARLPITGEGIEAELEVPASLDFGGVDVGDRTGLQVRVKNLARRAIPAPVVRFEGADAASFSSMFPLGEVPAEGVGLLDVAFAPQRRGPLAATLSIAPCETCAAATIALSGTGYDAQVVPVPERLEFGTVSPGGFRTHELQLENRGERTARIASARAGDPAFRIEARAWPIVLDPGEAALVWVTFEPIEVGDRVTAAEFVGESGATLAAATVAGHGGGAILEVDAAVDLGQRPFGWTGYATTVVRNVGEPEATQLQDARVEGSTAWTVADPVAGLEVGLIPGTVRLAFSGRVVGRADGTLVLTTSDPEQRELRIPLVAEVIAQPACALRVTPDPLRFGLVKRGDRHLRDLLVESVGEGPCLVWNLGMAPGGDPDFSLVLAEPFLELAAGASTTLQVAFTPDQVTGAVQAATVTWRTSNPATPPGALLVSGYASDLDLVVEPNPLDFGRVPLDRAPHETFRVWNRGALAATLTGHSFAAGSSPEVTLISVPGYPAPLSHDVAVWYEAGYDPVEVGPDRAELEITVAGEPVPLIAVIEGEGHDGPCGDYCEPPVPVCPGSQSVIVNRPVELNGSATDPQGDPVDCLWTVVSAPVGSSEQPRPPDTCATSFLPDSVGDYTLQLAATDDLGNQATCTTVLEVRPPGGGLWVEMYWEQYSNDFDLHLLNGGGSGDPHRLASWNDLAWDCFYRHPSASWDNPGPGDDGNLDRDLTSGFGVENIRVDQPSESHPYHVGVVWYSNHAGPTTHSVFTNVYCWGVPIAHTTSTMVFKAGNVKYTHFVGSVSFQPGGTCTWTPDGTEAR